MVSAYNAIDAGCPGSKVDRSSDTVSPTGQASPTAAADRRSHSTASGSGDGSVRSTPIPAWIMIRAAAIPVSKEISAFHASTTVRGRRARIQPPSMSPLISCSGNCNSTEGDIVVGEADDSKLGDSFVHL